MAKSVRQKSIWVPLPGGDQLHLRRIWSDPRGIPLFLLHGSIENGRIFYSESGKGLGPFLAEHGFDVYVGDLRGRGESRPPIGPHSNYGQTEAIVEDIPAILEKIKTLRGKYPVHWIGHSWGGVLLASVYARFPRLRKSVKSFVCFASKRNVRVFNLHKLLILDLFWNIAAPLLIRYYGYLPMKRLGLGAENESAESQSHCKVWARAGIPWVDPKDGFDYAKALGRSGVPPSLHLVGCADHCLGNPKDVEDFLRETHPRRFEFRILSRANGNLRDYGHSDLLTDPKAREDHFPWVVDWLNRLTRPGRR